MYISDQFLLIFQHLRDRPHLSPLIDPRSWWKWAYSHVSKTTTEHRRQWSLEYIMERRQLRHRYIPLHKKRLEKGPLKGGDAAAMEFLERKLSVNDILFFRALAAAELRLELKVITYPLVLVDYYYYLVLFAIELILYWFFSSLLSHLIIVDISDISSRAASEQRLY